MMTETDEELNRLNDRLVCVNYNVRALVWRGLFAVYAVLDILVIVGVLYLCQSA